MRLRSALLLCSLTMLAACQQEASAPTTTTESTPAAAGTAPADAAATPSPTPATSTGEASFSGKVNGQPFLAQTDNACMANTLNKDAKPQLLFTFAATEGDDAIQVGIDSSPTGPGPRDVYYALANIGEASYMTLIASKAEVTAIEDVDDGFLVSGTFEMSMKGFSTENDAIQNHELTVGEARFGKIHCLDMAKAMKAAGLAQ